jgi:hypothetical protein
MARWHSCNILQRGPQTQHLWQFDAHSFSLQREHAAPVSDPLPPHLVGKSWSSLWQPRLNVAWLPPESVFIRVAQFPTSTPEEIRAMVELQMEKLSPIPVTQAVWTMHVIPPAAGVPRLAASEKGSMQTVAVTIVPRSAVEELLGQLEEQGFMADRLEVPELDQLQATDIREDGAWIYPGTPVSNRALVAWWYGGVLQNLALLTASGADPAAGLKDQLMQMAWGGELEDWLTSPPSWHLVAEGAVAQEWEQWLRAALDQPVQTVAPVSGSALAALSARRAAEASPDLSLLPPEFAARYRQKFVDRLWLRGLGALLVLYGVGCIIYFIAVGFLRFQTTGVESQVNVITPGYTNALQIKARFDVLKERQELKFAALDCYEKTAELMPEGLVLESLNFSDGKKLMLSGTAPAQQVDGVIDFSGKLRKATKNGQPLFTPERAVPLITHVNPVNSTVTWSFGLELKRVEEQ